MFENLDPQIIAGAFSLVGTLATALIGQVIISRKRLVEKLEIAQADIAYLLHVETLHCEKHREMNRASFKLRIRKEATEYGLSWSGRFTPGRVRSNRGGRPLSTTISARIIVLARLILRAMIHAIAYVVKNAPRWFDIVLVTVENGVAKTLAARIFTMRKA